MKKKITVLIVDDSLLIRKLLTEIFSSDPELEVVGSAVDPFDAREKIKALNPDVITLDIEMPKMDGISFLEKIISLRPMPVVMISSLTQKGADVTIKALEIGAIDYIAKPTKNPNRENLLELKNEMIEKIKIASKVKVKGGRRINSNNSVKTLTFPSKKPIKTKLIAIGASTGGVEALREVLSNMPVNSPPIVVVQHMPPNFTTSFAKRLNNICKMHVHEAENNQHILPGNIYIAPGNMHMRIKQNGTSYSCSVMSGENVSGHCPSVDVLFESVSKCYKTPSIGVILTGMGSDGAAGMLQMKEAGSYTIGQNKDTCIVYGMPKEAYNAGAVDIEKPLVDIAREIVETCTR